MAAVFFCRIICFLSLEVVTNLPGGVDMELPIRENLMLVDTAADVLLPHVMEVFQASMRGAILLISRGYLRREFVADPESRKMGTSQYSTLR